MITVLLFAICLTQTVDPPTWPNQFYQSFVESVTSSGSKSYTVGQHWFDYTNKRSRVDRTNGNNNFICNSILPNSTTACTNLVVNETRYIIFPEIRQGCVCCDAAHGCGVLRPNWLS
jgi:hypothetical protein